MKRGTLTKADVLAATEDTADGNGLTLKVSGGRKFWSYRYSCPLKGGQETMVLGHVKDGLEDPNTARDLRDAARLKVRAGFNPKDQRDSKIAGLGKVTFGKFAELHAPRLGPKKGLDIFIRDMTKKVGALADLHPAAITADHVADALRPYWIDRQPTAQRLRQRIEVVWFAAQADGLIGADEVNPALKKGPMQHKLKKVPKRKRHHHASLPYPELAPFMARLRAKDQMSCYLLEWVILSACRVGEACLATWAEVDLKKRCWVIPVEHLKTEDDDGEAIHAHHVPLTRAMMKVLFLARPRGKTPAPGDLIFPNPRGRKKLGYVPNSIWQLLQHFKLAGRPTVHGFRTTFGDWAREAGYSREWIDLALSHEVGDETSSAYQRSKLVELRRGMMRAWSAFCAQPPSRAVEPLRIAA